MTLRSIFKALWPALVFVVIVVASSSTVITSKAWVKWVSQNSPWHLTEEQFGVFWQSWWWLFVKGWHVTEFVIVTVLVGWCLLRLGWRDRRRVLVWAGSFGLVFAVSDEVHQLFVPKRGGRVTDFLIDASGVVIGLLLLVPLVNRAVKRSKSTHGESLS